MTYILGVNAGLATFHDPAACLVDEHGTVLAAIEEERLNRQRQAGSFPATAPSVNLEPPPSPHERDTHPRPTAGA